MPRRNLSEEEKRNRKIDREHATVTRQNSDEYIERQKELHRVQQAEWAKANPDKIARYMDNWEAKNPDYFRQHDRDRYQRDKEKIKARARAYYEKNKVRINAERRSKRAELAALRRPKTKIKLAIVRV